MSLCDDQDIRTFHVDPTIMLPGPDGRPQPYVPFRLGLSAIQLRRDARPSPLGTPGRHLNGSSASTSSSASTANIATRVMPPPHGLPSARHSSAGVMRPPITPTIPAIPQHGSPTRPSPPATNGIGHESISGSEQDVKLSTPVAGSNAGSPTQGDDTMQVDGPGVSMGSPVRPKSQTPSMTPIPNGFTIPSVNNFSSHISSNGAYPHHASIRGNNIMKSALAATLSVQDGNNVSIRQAPPYMGLVTPGSNYSAQLQAARQMQWAAIQQQQQHQQQQRPQMLADGAAMDGTLAASPSLNGVPPRTPSANGTRPVSLSRGLSSPSVAQAMVAGQGRASPGATHIGRLTPHPPHSPPNVNMLSPGLGAAQPHSSPPRSQPPMPSPSLQARQIVGGSGVGY